MAAHPVPADVIGEEHLDVVTTANVLTGESRPRSEVHREGCYHRAVHVWLYAESTGELLLQQRAADKDSWPNLWDISSAGHIAAGDTPLASARRELEEELGVTLPEAALEHLYTSLHQSVTNGGQFVNNEFDYVYLATLLEPIPVESFALQKEEVAGVKWMRYQEYEAALAAGDPAYVPYDEYQDEADLFKTIRARYESDSKAREEKLRRQKERYTPVTLSANLASLKAGDRDAVQYIVRAAQVLEAIFLEQEWAANGELREYLEQRGSAEDAAELERLKLQYFLINKSPWSVLDESEAFLTTADSPPVEAVGAVKAPAPGAGGVFFRAAFPQQKPPGSNFYPSDMDNKEFEAWEATLSEEQRKQALGFFSVIRRQESARCGALSAVPYSQQHAVYLKDAASLLTSAASAAETPSLKDYLEKRAAAFLSNEYYNADIAWMDLKSEVDITMGPYETYEDNLFGYKATFEAFVGIRDQEATEQVNLFSNYLQELEDHLPVAAEYRGHVAGASPIRVIRLVYASGVRVSHAPSPSSSSSSPRPPPPPTPPPRPRAPPLRPLPPPPPLPSSYPRPPGSPSPPSPSACLGGLHASTWLVRGVRCIFSAAVAAPAWQAVTFSGPHV